MFVLGVTSVTQVNVVCSEVVVVDSWLHELQPRRRNLHYAPDCRDCSSGV